MPKRKVLQTVILHRATGRVVPTVGEIFDFTPEEVETLNRLNPEALGRPVQEVDLENQAAQEAAQKAKAEQAAKEKGSKKNVAKDNSDDEV
ncbi:DUF7443 domain-containing protein [Providencia sp. CRPN22473]